MENNKEVLQAISSLREEMEQTNLEMKRSISSLREEMQIGFRSVNKRLDGIENELRKIDTVLGYQEQYDNIPS